MFPHRTAFYFDVEDQIYKPEDVGVDPNGLRPWLIDANGNFAMNCEDGAVSCPEQEDIIPLASTGLEDSEGNEVYEGHVMRVLSGDTKIVVYRKGCFRLLRDRLQKPLVNYCPNIPIIGHALTDPALVPDGFDVEDYFGVEKT